MSDGIAPAIDKVGEPAPTAPEAEVAAPTMATAAPTSEPAAEPKPDEKMTEDGAKGSLKVPKPVEVMSVPQTPINNGTPAGGTPRPELKIDEEVKEKPKEEEAVVILGLQEPESTPVDSEPKDSEAMDTEPITDKLTEVATNGSSKDVEMTGALPSSDSSESASGEKRKLDDEPSTTNGEASEDDKSGSDGRSDKKARVEDVPDQPATNGKSKAKREKKSAIPVAGRTARKTRSQGPVEV
ncbi:hypothetical protein AK830_g9395 [Neonectria ditissima]|uniref:Uncharacterized protein n=1 Tax=Neonectria ditissima TaxID=78410 RepID=A0A0P7B9L7_9HYPO|nr:hypothetical protein AK830_g9395 [Neonectria ditissima]